MLKNITSVPRAKLAPRLVTRQSPLATVLSRVLYLAALLWARDVAVHPTQAYPQTGISWPHVTAFKIATGFTQPTHITHAGDGSGRLFIVEKAGRVKILKNNTVLPTPFLDISSRVLSSGLEQGLLSVAFPPNYATKRYFYVNYTKAEPGDETSGVTIIARYRLTTDPDIADPNSEEVILRIDQPYTNHNGGQLAFGPNDGYLYIGMGDGGSGGDPENCAQNLTGGPPCNQKLLGKLLRIDVESVTTGYVVPATNPVLGSTRSEIWALGFRNPWRFSFDRQTNDLYIADVGQAIREEVNFQPASSSGGQNYGWRLMEGSLCFNPSTGCNDPSLNLVLPVAEYDHSQGDCSITGGMVYRGQLYPRMQGIYFYGDFCSGRIWGLKHDGTAWRQALLTSLTNAPFSISTFGEDEAGELYVADITRGIIYMLIEGSRWWFPWYDNVFMQTSLLIDNPSPNETASCAVSIGGGIQGVHAVPPASRVTPQYPGTLNGPVRVDCDLPVIVSQRALDQNSLNEVAGILQPRLNRRWFFPWYDDVYMQTWLLIGNTGTQVANCQVFIEGVLRGSYLISPNHGVAPKYPGILGGPVKIECDQPVVASERAVYSGSFNEVMGLPPTEFSSQQWFSWYDNVFMTTWLLIGNPSSSQTAICTAFLAGSAQGSQSIRPGSRVALQFAGALTGPVKVECNIPVFASQRALYKGSFSEVMGMSPLAFHTTPWLQEYDQVQMNTWLLIGNPSNAQTSCTIFIANVQRSTHVIAGSGLVVQQVSRNYGRTGQDQLPEPGLCRRTGHF